MSDRHDVVVIGAGHNGLTAAALLARRGRKVLVLERRPYVGGLAAGEEFHPGYRTAGVLHDTAGVRRWVVDRLGLREHGLRFRAGEAPTLLAERKGEGLLLSRDPERAVDELSRRSREDGRRYREYRAFLARIVPTFRRLFDRSPADLFEPGLGDLLQLGRAALSLRMLGTRDMMEVLRITPMCVADWLDEWFETDLLKAGLAAPAIEGCFAGPRSPGTVANLLWVESSVDAAVAGGPRSLIDALERAAKAYGAEIRCGEAVSQVAIENGKVSGVILESGQHLQATAVAASCDPRHLMLDLLPGAQLALEAASNVAAFRARGTVARVDLALAGYPEFSCRPGLHAERIRTGESLDDLERAFDPVKYRRFSRRPALDIAVPTIESPELAPAGHHVFSILVHCAPYDLDGGWSEASKEELYRAVVETLSENAPRVEQAIVGRRVLSPLDLEATYGVTGGHLFHGEHAIDQLAVRPTPECAGYRTPLPGLFLCGSGSHPGGGITCAPGALAARVILKSAD
jgi:phytoene dehydrogenase-like protein